MKFLAECYNYKVIHTDTLFLLLYKLINWDIQENKEDKRFAALDSADDCFRIRLVCTLLDNLGKFFNKGKRALLMDRFLIFFQRYIFTKSYILMDLEFMMLDTFDTLRPRKAPKLASLDEATTACNRIVSAENNFHQEVDLQNPDSVTEAARNIESVAFIIQQYCTNGGGDAQPKVSEREPSPEQEVEEDDNPPETPTSPSAEDNRSVATKPATDDPLDAQEIANFDNEFEAMMQESANDARKGVTS